MKRINIKKEKAPEKSKCSICDCATKSHNAFYHLKQALHCSLHTSIRPSYLSGQNSTIASSVYLFINFYTTIGGSLFGKSFFKHTDNRIRKFNFSNDSFKQFVRIAICKKWNCFIKFQNITPFMLQKSLSNSNKTTNSITSSFNFKFTLVKW